MLKHWISLGVNEGDSVILQQKIRMANLISIINGFVIGIPFIVISLLYFRPLFWIPLLGLVACVIVLIFAKIGLTLVSRFIVMLSPVFLATLFHMYLVDSKDGSVLGLYMIQLTFSLIPFLVFSFREPEQLIFGGLVCLAINLFFPELSNLIKADFENLMLIQSGWMNRLLITLSILIGSAVVMALSFFNEEGEKRALSLIEKTNDANKKLLENRKETEKNIKELELARQEEEKRNWIVSGISMVNDIIRTTNNMEDLSFRLISELVKYVKMNQGGIFVVEEDSEGEFLELKASYAYDRKKYIDKKVRPGIGLLGQIYLEKEFTYLEEIPEDYLYITSGMGDAPPKTLILLPLIFNEKVEGAMEMAAFKPLEQYQIDFLLQISEVIAQFINSFKVNERTRQLLEESQLRTEQLRAQEEEMRQNMEEMHATQEEMARTQKELAEKEANFDTLINTASDSIITIDLDYNIILMNRTLKNRYVGTQYAAIKEGSNVMELLGDASEEWKGYYDRAFAGESMKFTIQSSVLGEDSWREYDINPLRNDLGEITGASVFSRDVTDRLNAENEIKERDFVVDAMINSTEDTFFAIDPEYNILVANEVLKERFRQSNIELSRGMNVLELLPDGTREMWKDRYDRALRGESFEMEEERPLKNQVIFTLISCSPIKTEDGEILGASVMSKDITEKRVLREKLEVLRTKFEELQKKTGK